MATDVWTRPIEELAGFMYANYSTKDLRHTEALAAVLQARVALQIADSQRKAGEDLARAARDTARATGGLLKATIGGRGR